MRCVVFLCVILLGCSSSQPRFKGFEKISGNWKYVDGQEIFYENWKQVNDRLIGKGCLLQGKDTLFSENLLVEIVNDKLVYIADVPGQNPTLFYCKSHNFDEWLFVNEEHDFPKTILYSLSAGNRKLTITLDGIENGKRKKEVMIFNTFEK